MNINYGIKLKKKDLDDNNGLIKYFSLLSIPLTKTLKPNFLYNCKILFL